MRALKKYIAFTRHEYYCVCAAKRDKNGKGKQHSCLSALLLYPFFNMNFANLHLVTKKTMLV